MISPGTLFRGVLNQLTLSFTLTHHLTTLLGRGGSSGFTSRSCKSYMSKLGKNWSSWQGWPGLRSWKTLCMKSQLSFNRENLCSECSHKDKCGAHASSAGPRGPEIEAWGPRDKVLGGGLPGQPPRHVLCATCGDCKGLSPAAQARAAATYQLSDLE